MRQRCRCSWLRPLLTGVFFVTRFFVTACFRPIRRDKKYARPPELAIFCHFDKKYGCLKRAPDFLSSSMFAALAAASAASVAAVSSSEPLFATTFSPGNYFRAGRFDADAFLASLPVRAPSRSRSTRSWHPPYCVLHFHSPVLFCWSSAPTHRAVRSVCATCCARN